MSERLKNYKRRSISIPNTLDELIAIKFRESSYSFINDLIVELLELGLIKLQEDAEIKNQQKEILNKINKYLSIQS